ncbi:hypothetical protein D4764_13G0007490 [Takifugu flavidus]|uniref:Uncharacterized protein n=1 Tax=Takifugu flavidus TaxID=433684 RepID=A0A5C6PCY7_9TELE|nr:hypothetical protein D4764_13G0007490 [Takifugu flavidus]
MAGRRHLWTEAGVLKGNGDRQNGDAPQQLQAEQLPVLIPNEASPKHPITTARTHHQACPPSFPPGEHLPAAVCWLNVDQLLTTNY